MPFREELARRYPDVYSSLIEAEKHFQESMYLNNIISMNADHSLTILCQNVLKEANERAQQKIVNN